MKIMDEERKLSRGEAKRRRRVLAEERRRVPDQKIIIDIGRAELRLGEVSALLEDETLESKDRISLEVEQIFLLCRVGKIDQSERQSRHDRLLKRLQVENAELLDYLMREESGTTPFGEIRDRIFPPSKIAGYHTKRGY